MLQCSLHVLSSGLCCMVFPGAILIFSHILPTNPLFSPHITEAPSVLSSLSLFQGSFMTFTHLDTSSNMSFPVVVSCTDLTPKCSSVINELESTPQMKISDQQQRFCLGLHLKMLVFVWTQDVTHFNHAVLQKLPSVNTQADLAFSSATINLSQQLHSVNLLL